MRGGSGAKVVSAMLHKGGSGHSLRCAYRSAMRDEVSFRCNCAKVSFEATALSKTVVCANGITPPAKRCYARIALGD